MYQDVRSTCRAIVIIITPFVVFKMSLTCRDNFVFVKNVMTFKTCPLVRIGPYSLRVHCFCNMEIAVFLLHRTHLLHLCHARPVPVPYNLKGPLSATPTRILVLYFLWSVSKQNRSLRNYMYMYLR